MRKSVWMLSTCLFAASAPAMAQDSAGSGDAAGQTPTTPVESPTAQGAVQAETGAAAPTPEDSDVNRGEIIVTATRRASPLSNVPIAVSAVTAQSLQNSGATDIRQLNQLAPSLLVSSTGNESQASARIRGIGTVGDNPGLESSVAVFIDGVYRSRTGSGLNELGEIERVEVLRGPQGTLFGRNASAGLINVVSKRPNLNESEGYAEATYGNYDFLRLSGGLSGPIGGDTLGFRLDGVYVQRDGFYRNVTQGGGSESRVNDRDRYFVRGQLLFEPTDALSVRLIGDYSKRDESCCAAVYIATKETTDPTANPAAFAAVGGNNVDGAIAFSGTNRIVEILRAPPFNSPVGRQADLDPFNREIEVTPGRTFRNETEDYGLSGQIDFDLGPGTLTSITAYRQYKAGGAGDVDYNVADIFYRADDGNASRRFKTFSQELRFQGSAFADRLDYLVGAYYSNEKLRLLDNSRFGTQYGAFAACRVVATVNPNRALQNPANPGCLSTGLVAPGVTARAAFGAGFGAAGPAFLGALDRLSTLNDLGSSRDEYNQKSENYAFFTHNIFNFTDNLSLTLGARYTNETKDFDATFANNNTVCPAQQRALGPLLTNPALGALAGAIVTLSCTGNSSVQINSLALDDRRKEDEITGTAVLSFKPTPQLLTYASYSKGYKAGGFNLDRSDLGGPNGALSPRSNADVTGLQFDAEKVDSYEIGAKFTRRNFNLNVAIFRQEFENFQLNTFNGSVFIVQNIQACKESLNFADRDNSLATGTCTAGTKPGLISQGIELEAAFYPTRDIQISVGHTYADAQFRKNLVGSDAGEALSPALFRLPGRNLSNAPVRVQTASFTWTPELTSGGIKGLVYVDGRVTSGYNTGSDLFPEKFQESYALVNARIGIRGPQGLWALELWGQNIFNKDYQQVAFNTPFQGAGSIAQTQAFGTTANQLFSSFLAEPRTYGATVRTRF